MTEQKTIRQDFKGINLGSIFNAFQIIRRNNGFASQKDVDKLKFAVPEELHDYCRQTGTQSNNMSLYINGYGDPSFVSQLKNLKIPQPTVSYWYAFVDFYHKWGYKGAAITLNVNSSFTNKDRFQEDVLDTLFFLEQNGVNIIQLELGNELYYYPEFTLITRGSPSAFERARLGLTNKSIESNILNSCRQLVNHLEWCTSKLRQAGYTQPIGVPVSPPVAMRERIFTQAMLEKRFYNFIVPHIYTADASDTGINTKVNSDLSTFPKELEKRVTEFNFNYQLKPEGHTRTNQEVYYAFKRSFLVNNVNTYFFHCLWNRSDANGWAKGVL